VPEATPDELAELKEQLANEENQTAGETTVIVPAGIPPSAGDENLLTLEEDWLKKRPKPR
jgi:hypothetical protein